MDKKTYDFLNTWGILPEKVDMQVLCDSFLDEMKKGLQGKESSLDMIPTYVSESIKIVPGEQVIVIDAGGTNLRTCLVTFDEHFEPQITDFRKTTMPGSDREVTADEFFSIFANQVEPIIDKSDYIGFCFSYAATITADHDGIPVKFSKEIKAPQVIGTRIGRRLLEELGRRGHAVQNKRLAVVNDTVTTLLAGMAEGSRSHYGGYVGFILGTGTNTAYVEDNKEITKVSGLPSGRQVINVESGNFDSPGGKIDELFVAGTKEPDAYHFEKMISGAYLGAMSSLVLRKAVECKVLSEAFGKRFEAEGDVDTTQMSHYLEMPFNHDYKLVRCVEGNEKDAIALWHILESIIERAGKQTAANLASAVLKTDIGMDPLHPVCINADGTTYYKTAYLEKYTEYYLEQFLTKVHHRYVTFVHIDNSPTIGAAIAALGLRD